jgi:hypothetical protein
MISPGLLATLAAPLLPLAERITWAGFVNYWTTYIRGTDRILQVVLLLGAVSVYIIMSGGHWRRK